MLAENITAIVARNERWSGAAASEPYEAGWAREAIFFVRALKDPKGKAPTAWVELSADGMRWVRDGNEFRMPARRDDVSMVKVAHFGNWLRVATTFEEEAECTVLVTLHLKG